MKNTNSISAVVVLLCGVVIGLSMLTACGSASGSVYHTRVQVAGPHLHIGAVVTTLPRGYHTVRHHKTVYYMHNGVFYSAHGRSWRVVRPPVGMVVPHLPRPAQRYRSGSIWLWKYNGVVYRQRSRGYVVVRLH